MKLYIHHLMWWMVHPYNKPQDLLLFSGQLALFPRSSSLGSVHHLDRLWTQGRSPSHQHKQIVVDRSTRPSKQDCHFIGVWKQIGKADRIQKQRGREVGMLLFFFIKLVLTVEWSSLEAARSMACDLTPLIVAGFRLQRTQTFRFYILTQQQIFITFWIAYNKLNYKVPARKKYPN